MLADLNAGVRVPTLVLDHGRPLPESNAILWYFADGTQYLPTDPYERAQVLQWLFFEQNSQPNIAVMRGAIAGPRPDAHGSGLRQAAPTSDRPDGQSYKSHA